jgi:hypothetical protein
VPRWGSIANAWTEVSIPDRTRKVPTIDIEKAITASIIVHAFRAPRAARTLVEWRSAVAASHGISEAFSTGSQNQ